MRNDELNFVEQLESLARSNNPELIREQLADERPEDVADATVFLVSDMARCITGTTLFVDGGRTIFSGIHHTD